MNRGKDNNLTDDERQEVLWAVAAALDSQARAWKDGRNAAAHVVLEAARRKLSCHVGQHGNADRITVRDDDTGRIDVTGPAVVRVPAGAEYVIVTGMTLAFPADSEVWLKLWPEDDDR
jgi:hypothetical protein